MNEEKLCQLLATRARALRKKLLRGASPEHQPLIKLRLNLVSLRVPVTEKFVKMAAVVDHLSVNTIQMLHVRLAPREHSSRTVQKRPTALKTTSLRESAVDHATLLHHAAVTTGMSVQHVRHTEIAMTVQLVLLTETAMAHQREAATTATSVQLVQRLVTEMTVQHVRLTATAMTAQLVRSAQAMVAVIGHRVETKAPVAQLKKLGMIAMIVQHVQRLVTAMTVQHVRLTETAMTVQHEVVLIASSRAVHHSVVALVIAIAQSVRHTANQIQQDLKTAMQSVETFLEIATQEVMTLRLETHTVQIVPLVMTHANQHSAEHAIQTQTKKLSLKTRFLSA
ncbi:unannotated protein [freshwater metagenome]|uniref:Unannotated protein n=1 Tax=freshwater metagenome TaxID=449393 RepID=A0A6J6CS94_9ZZZZ